MSFCSTGLTPSPSNLSLSDASATQCRRQHHRSLAVDFRVFECPRNPPTKLALAPLQLSAIENRSFGPKCARSGSSISKTFVEESGDSEPRIGDGDDGGSGGGDGDSFGGGGGGGNGGGDGEEEEFGPIMKFEEVMNEAEGRGVSLPSDMVEAAKTTGIRKAFLFRYLDLQVKFFPVILGFKFRVVYMYTQAHTDTHTHTHIGFRNVM